MKSILLLAATLLTACTTYEERPVDPADSAAQLDARTLDDQGLRNFIDENAIQSGHEWPLPRWRLDELTLAAIYFHPDLEVARAQLAVASAAIATAEQRPNPGASVSPGYNTDTDIPTPWIVVANLDLRFETAGKRRYRSAQAMHLAEVSRLNIASVAWQVRDRVRRSLLELYAAQQTQVLLRSRIAYELENIRLLELQYQLGAISSFELAQARLLADRSRLDLLDAERQNVEARVRMAAAIGVPVRAIDDVELSFDDFDELPGDIPDAGARREALSNRADVLGALAEYAASQAALQLQIANQYPDVNLGPGYEYDQGDDKWSVGFSLTLPVFNHNQGAVAQALARREEAAARFNALQAQVLAEIDVALAGYRAALRTKQETDSMLAVMTSQEARSQMMFATGDISRGELVALNLQLSVSALARLDAAVKAQQAAGQLEYALQIPLDLSTSAWQTTLPSYGSADAGDHP